MERSLTRWVFRATLFFLRFQDLGLLLNSLKEAVKTVTAITRFPVTRKAASSDGAFVKAADEAFRDEVVNSPGAAGMMFSSESAQRVVLDDTKNISVSYEPLICSENIAVGLPHGSMFRVRIAPRCVYSCF